MPPETAAVDLPSPARRTFLAGPLAVLSVISFVSSLGIGVMLPLIPLFAVSLGASPVQLGLLTSAFAGASALGQLGAGILSDRFGARAFIRAGIATYAAANALIATATRALALIAYRGLAGLGSGSNLVAQRLYVAQAVTPARMAFANGILSAAWSAGQIAGPAFGGIVTTVAGLRAPFAIVAVTSGLSFAGAFLLPQAAAGSDPPPPTEGTRGAPLHEPAHSPSSRRALILLFVAQLMALAAFGAFITVYAPLAKQILGWSTFEVGIIFSVFSVGSITLGPWLSHLADRAGRRVVGGLAALPVALFGPVLILDPPRLVLYAVSVVGGGGMTAFNAAWYALLTEAAPGARQGRTFGLISAASNLGMILGAMGASAIWGAAGLPTAMVVGTIPIALAGVALLFLPRQSHRR